MSNLQRTQIYLQEEQIQQLKAASQKEHLPMSVLIRQAIDKFLSHKTGQKKWNKDTLVKTVGKITLKTSTASVDHDRILYGG